MYIYHIPASWEVAVSEFIDWGGGEWGRATPLNPPLIGLVWYVLVEVQSHELMQCLGQFIILNHKMTLALADP